jgi:hypothetical protein
MALAILVCAAAVAVLVHAQPASASMTGYGGATAKAQAEPLGNGDGRIHVIPTLSTLSVKNGGALTIQAVVKASAPIVTVEARITRDSGTLNAAPIATVQLRPAPGKLGGINAAGTLGLWQAEWQASGLEETAYTVALRIEDATGHAFTDTSLHFTDPIAGRTQIGTTNYPNGGMRRIDAAHDLLCEKDLASAVIDATHGFAYFGTRTTPGRVVKVALGIGSAAPSRTSALILRTGENNLTSAAIDPSAGYAYFGTMTAPGQVVKVRLGDATEAPSRIGSVVLEPGEDWLGSAVVFTASGVAFFGTSTSPGRVVKVALGSGAAAPYRVAGLTLDSGEDDLSSAVIDPANGYAYFGTLTSPGRVIKVALGAFSEPPRRVGAVGLESDEGRLTCAVIDTINQYAYFGTDKYNGRVVKVALGSGANPPTRVGVLVLDNGEDFLRSAVIHAGDGYAYFATYAAPGRVVKVALGSGPTPPSRLGAVALGHMEDNPQCAVIDSENGYAYFGTYTSPGLVVKVNLQSGSDAAPTRIASATLEAAEEYLLTAVANVNSGYAYFGTSSYPEGLARVVKVALGNGSVAPSRVGAVTLADGERNLGSAVIDAANGFAYFGTLTTPGRVVKIALGTGSDPPSRVGAVTLESGEDTLECAVIDPINGFAYFGTATWPGRVVKVALGTGSEAPSRVGAVTLENGENVLRSAVIDTGNGYAYFGTLKYPSKVVKVALGEGAAPPTRVGAVTLRSSEYGLCSSAIDVANGYAYFGTYSSPARVVKVALGSGASLPSRVGALTLEYGENDLRSVVADLAGGFAVFSRDDTRQLVKVALGPGSAEPRREGVVTLDLGEDSPSSAIIDATLGYAYFGTASSPGTVVRVGLSQKGFIKGTRVAVPEQADVSAVRFFSHTAMGNVRIGLYSSSTPPSLLWQSGVIANTGAGTWLSSTIAAGSPSVLNLAPGDYWLAWQVDTASQVPSYAKGAVGDGLFVPWPWSSFPGSLDSATSSAPTLTDEVWSAYIVYDSCAEIAPLSMDFAAGGGAGTVNVTAGSACTWTASSNEPWIDVDSGASGDGDGVVGYRVAANYGAARVGSLTIAGQPHSILQAAAFHEIDTGLPDVAAAGLAWGDYDNDSDLDLLLAGFSYDSVIAGVYPNNGGGGFSNFAAHFGSLTSAAAWGDYDRDGDLDVLLTGGNYPNARSEVHRNDGNGVFVRIAAALAGVISSSASWADYDNDGDLDILLSGATSWNGSSPSISRVYRNDGSGLFTDIQAGLKGVADGSVAWGDYDNDGDLDILLVGDAGDSSARVPIARIYRNEGNGSFSETTANLIGVSAGAVAWGDFDSDGDLDILLAGDVSTNVMSPVPIAKIYRNEGSGVFTDENANLAGVAGCSAAWGDYDNDGDLDVVLSGDASLTVSLAPRASVYRNDGDARFVDIDLGLPGLAGGMAAWGDMDNDGDLDLVLTGLPGLRHTATRVFRNDIGVANTPPTAPNGLTASKGAGEVALAWAASSDSQTLPAGLTYNVCVATTPGGVNVLSPMASTPDGQRRLPQLGNANHGTTAVLKSLAPGTYYWSVQAIDNAFAGSPFAAESTFTVCSASIDPLSASVASGGAIGTVAVTTGDGCTWTAETQDAWITVSSGTPAIGSGSVGYSVAANAGPLRTGTITIAGQTFAVNQAAGVGLTVSKTGAGTGTVASSPAGIDCGATCSALFDADAVVTLSAVGAAASSFAGWSGEGCSGVGACQVTMSQALSVTAMFVLVPQTAFVPLAPCRGIDTRNPGNAPALAASSTRTFSLAGLCGLPAGAKAVAVNATVVGAEATGELRVVGGHLSSTVTSSLSIPLARARANNAIVQLAPDGSQSITVINDSAGPVHFILDLNGCFQ